MKKVLITGANSYIGTAFEEWVNVNCSEIQTETLDMRGDEWREQDFHPYDTVFHVAGIAHADVGKVTDKQKAMYYKINTKLTAECARKAKNEGVRQFIFMSSVIVYGESAGIGKSRVITKSTQVNPANFYGDSKVKAERELQKLTDEKFKVVILRPPMIYGQGAKGNYPMLAKMAKKLPVFPDIRNERSMLYVENLCRFIELMIENEESGIFFPQNKDYVLTSEMVAKIAEVHGNKIHMTKIFNPILLFIGKIGGKFGGLVNKAFGNLVYEQEMSFYKEDYRVYDLEESIKAAEGKK